MVHLTIPPSLVPPPTPFNLHIPNTNIILLVDYNIRDRIERWVVNALRDAYDDLTRYPGFESISESIAPDKFLEYDGNPDESASVSTDIDLILQRNLTYGLFVDCLVVMNWFVVTYPEWDFGFDVGIDGVPGSMGRCTLTTRGGR